MAITEEFASKRIVSYIFGRDCSFFKTSLTLYYEENITPSKSYFYFLMAKQWRRRRATNWNFLTTFVATTPPFNLFVKTEASCNLNLSICVRTAPSLTWRALSAFVASAVFIMKTFCTFVGHLRHHECNTSIFRRPGLVVRKSIACWSILHEIKIWYLKLLGFILDPDQ